MALSDKKTTVHLEISGIDLPIFHVGDVREAITELEDEIIKLLYNLDFPQAGVHKVIKDVFGENLVKGVKDE
jgi:hypothetical protein